MQSNLQPAAKLLSSFKQNCVSLVMAKLTLYTTIICSSLLHYSDISKETVGNFYKK